MWRNKPYDVARSRKCNLVMVLLALVVGQLLLAYPATAQVYYPRSCRTTCRGGTQDVSRPSDAFKNINFQDNRASQWAGVMLKGLKEALAAPAGTLTPPTVARFLGIYAMAVYQAFAVWSPPARRFLPLTSDITSVAIASQFTQPAGPIPSDPAASLRAQEAAISGAASTFLGLFYQGQPASWPNVQVILAAMQGNATADQADQPRAFQQGQAIALEFYSIFGAADLHNDLKSALPSVYNIPTPQSTPAVTDPTSPNFVNSPFTWYPLRIPVSANAFTTGPGAVFPPDAYKNSTITPTKMPFLRGYAATKGLPLLRSVQEGRAQLLKGLNGPPLANDPAGFDAAMREVLAVSGQLDDVKKAIAEVWADGPDTTTPPGHWYRIALQESASTADIGSDVALDKTVWATLNVGMALHEAGMLVWQLKLQYMGGRPIAGIQSRLAPVTPFKTAWLGPYLGVGNRSIATWQPYQEINFVTPSFPGYVSGHAAFSAAAAEALRSFRSSFSQIMSKPQYNCFRIPAGFSKIEPRVNPTQPGYVAGYTDRPNGGPGTVGFAPATDIVTCWESYSEAAQQAANSRLYGGIHTNLDNNDGLKLGQRIGQLVGAVTAKLTASASRTKGSIKARTTQVGSTILGTDFSFVCPPNTFVTQFTGVYSTEGLNHLVTTCSNGVQLPRAGGVGPSAGNAELAATSFTDSSVLGYSGIKPVVTNSVYNVVFETSAGADTRQYGYSQAGSRSNLLCPTPMKMVGIAGRAGGVLEALQVLCQESAPSSPTPSPTPTRRTRGRGAAATVDATPAAVALEQASLPASPEAHC